MKRRNSMWGWGLSVLLLAGMTSGCAHRAFYRPANAKTLSQGYRAAFYRIVVNKHPMGTAKVFSEGGFKQPADGSQPVIDVRLRIRNTSDAPIGLDLAKTDLVVDTDNQSLVLKQPIVGVTYVAPVPPGGVVNEVLEYPLPTNVKPKDVNSFEFSWAVETGEGMYTQTTPFLRIHYGNAYYYYPGWYWGWPYGGPWYPYGWGWYGPYGSGDDWDDGWY
jgi:hypothetical protein